MKRDKSGRERQKETKRERKKERKRQRHGRKMIFTPH